MDVDELVAQQEIRDVLIRYTRGIDRMDGELVRSCYWPGAHDDHGAFQGPVEDFVEWFQTARGQRAMAAAAVLSHRTVRKNVRTSGTNRSGTSIAAKCPPRAWSTQCVTLYRCSTHARGILVTSAG
ncbi:MAG: hypothetical protein FJW86_09525 [Actinobacteria bacterium]|nr:hypothetical protein [Actinomycetota bacterium]